MLVIFIVLFRLFVYENQLCLCLVSSLVVGVFVKFFDLQNSCDIL